MTAIVSAMGEEVAPEMIQARADTPEQGNALIALLAARREHSHPQRHSGA